MAIPDHIIDKIQEKTDIVEVISRYIPLKKLGRNYKTTCPFHHEKTPSFIVSPDKQIYHCFGCNAGGNVFSFLMKYENVQFPEAVEMLAEKAGVVLPRYSGTSAESSIGSQLYKINETACQFFRDHLAGNKAAKEYLNLRGVGDETIAKFRIGYAPDAWEGLLTFLRKKGISDDLIEKAGLVVKNEKGGYYDRFRNRITFPIMDLKEKILGFGARVMDSSLPKYINSPETVIYSKGRNLYGLNFSKEHIKKEGYALVVEGYLDFLIPFQAGVRNIIATLGTALTVDHVKLLKRFAGTLIMVYDPDEAGQAASLRSLDLLIGEDVNVYIAELPSGYDPDGYIRKFGADEFHKLVKASKNVFDYKLDKLKARFNINSTHGKAGIAGEMLPTIARINNAVSRADLIKKLAEKLAVDEEALRTEIKKVKPDYGAQRYTVKPVEVKKDSKCAEMMVLSLLLEGGAYIKKTEQELSLDEFKSSSVRDLVGAIFEFHKLNKEITPAKLISHLGNTDELVYIISEAASMLEGLADKDKVLTDCITRIKKDSVKDMLDRLQAAIKMAHNQKDEDSVKRLVGQYNDILKANKV